MIYIKRSVDFNKEVTWVANDLDENKRRNVMLYAGPDVNGAIKAAGIAGMPRDEAVRQAQAEIDRCNKTDIVDTIGVA